MGIGKYFNPKHVLNTEWMHRNVTHKFSPSRWAYRKYVNPKQEAKMPENRYNGIEVQKSSYGDPIPIIFGQQRISITLGWYGNFQAIPHTDDSSGGGKGGGGGAAPQTTLTYSAALLGLLCEGPLTGTGIGNVWADKAITTATALGFTVFSGAGGQSPWSYLSTNFPSQAIGYDHTAYVAAGAFDLKDSPGMPNLSFEVKGLLQYGSGIVDAEPSAILNEYCNNADWGCNFNALGSLTNYQTYCKAMGFFLSPLETTQRPAMEFIRELLETTNSECYMSAGTLNIVPLADQAVTGNSVTFTPNLTPIYTFTDDDYLHEEGEDPVHNTRRGPAETFNVIRVEYLDRANNYNTTIAEASDAQDIAINGMRVAPTKNLHMITTKDVARSVAQLLLQRSLYYRNTYSFRVRGDYCLLEPMDVVAINEPGLELTNQLVRITEIEDDEEDEISITAEELPIGPGGAPVYNWQDAQGYYANYNTASGSVQAPYIITAPPMLVGPNGGYEVWIAVSGASASATWGGCRVMMSMDNVRYKNVGTIYGPARYGTLTSTLASGGDPDSTNTLGILLNNTALALQSATTADADNMRTLCYVDGEVLSYGTAALTGAGAYNLTYLRRGKYGSAISSHASGAWFIRLDGAIFRMPIDPGMIGQTIYFKFQSFNIYGGGLQDIAACTAYSYVPTMASSQVNLASGVTLVPRGACVVVGDTIYKKTTASSAWDSDCYSRESYASGCAVSFRANQTNLTFMMGLNSDPTTDQNYTSIDHVFYCIADGSCESRIDGGGSVAHGTYTTNTVFRIEYDNQTVKYFKDGVLVRQVENTGKTFFLDCSFYSPGASARNVTFTPLNAAPSIPWIARGSCVVSNNMAEKLSSGSTAYDSDVYSRASYASGCSVSAQAAQTNKEITIGLNTDPATDNSFASIDYAWLFSDNGNVYIEESGTNIGSQGTYTTSTVLMVKYDGQRIQYFKDGTLIREVAVSGKVFFADSSFYHAGGKLVNLEFLPLTTAEASPWVARGSCVCTNNTARKLTSGASSWDSDVYSSATYDSGCQLTFQAEIPNVYMMMGLNSDPTTDQSYTSLDYCFYLAGAAIYIYELNNSYSYGPFGNYDTSTVFNIKYDGQLVQYFVNGSLVRSTEARGLKLFADSSFLTPGAGVRNLEFGPLTTAPSIPWVARGNCVATATTMKKNGGSSAWDSDCYSYEAYANGCALTFQIDYPSYGDAMIGLNADPTTDQNYTSLDYAFEVYGTNSSATWAMYETGSVIATGSATGSTVFSITYDGRFVRYLVNGSIVRTVPKADQTFFLDSSFYTPGSAFRNVSFMPSGSATPAPYLTRGNCVVSDQNVQKVGGSIGWDSDCYSINGYPVCHVTFKANAANTDLMVGLNTDPLTDSSYTSIDYALYATAAGNIYVYEYPNSFGPFGTYTTSTVFAITYDGSNVRYYVDGALVRTTAAAGLTLFMDSSFYSPGAGINSLRYGPTTNLAVIDTAQVTPGSVTQYLLDSSSSSGSSFSASFTLCTISVSAKSFSYTIKLTAQVLANAEWGTLQLLDGSTVLKEIEIGTTDSIKRPYVLTITATVPAGTAKTFYLKSHAYDNGSGVAAVFYGARDMRGEVNYV